jgi:hypothetical protein
LCLNFNNSIKADDEWLFNSDDVVWNVYNFNIPIKKAVPLNDFLWILSDWKLCEKDEQGVYKCNLKDDHSINTYTTRPLDIFIDPFNDLRIVTPSGAIFWDYDGQIWNQSILPRCGEYVIDYFLSDATAIVLLDSSIWVGTWEDDLFFYSNDNWRCMNIGPGITSLAYDSEGNIWIGCSFGLYKYNNDNFTLFTIDDGLPDNNIVEIVTNNSGDVWVATENNISKYIDGTWNVLDSSDIIATSKIISISIDQFENIWVGTDDRGIVVFDGSTWKEIDNIPNLVGQRITSISFDKNGMAFIGTSDGRIYYSTKSPTYVKDNIRIRNLSLNNTFPNPFNSYVNIEYTIPVDSNARLSIINIEGKEVELLYDSFHQAGKYNYVWKNTKKASSGVYFCKLQSGPLAVYRKLLLLK